MSSSAPPPQNVQKQNDQSTTKSAAGVSAFLRLVAVAGFYLSSISALAYLGFGRDAFHSAAIAFGLTGAVLAHLALRGGGTPPAHRPVLVVVLIAGLAGGAWAAVPAKDTDAGPMTPEKTEQAPSSPRKPKPLTALALGGAVVVGVRPKAMAATHSELWMLTGTALTRYDPRRQADTPQDFPVDRKRPFDVAAFDERVVVVAGGVADFYSTRTERKTRDSLHFSEGPGRAALTEHATWLCNEIHSKVERLDEQTGELQHIGVPGPPKAITTDTDSVWVSTDDGFIVHIEERTGNVLGSYNTVDGPGPLVLGFGRVWISHPQRRVLTSANRRTGQEVGDPIAVAPDTKAVAAFAGSVWVLSGAGDLLQRIDPRSRQVVDQLKLPREPSGMVVFDRKLWVMSAATGLLHEVKVPPLPKRAQYRTP